jgi:hypothetical protein
MFYLALRLRSAVRAHWAPSRMNLLEIGVRFKVNRMQVHVRDPRQVMISWFHFLPHVARDLDPVQVLHHGMPDDYFERSTERQLDWLIDNWLRWTIDWIEGWVQAEREPWFKTKLLFTTFEDMIADPKAFFDRILDFYDVERDLFVHPSKPAHQGDRNFRLGAAGALQSGGQQLSIENVSGCGGTTDSQRAAQGCAGWLPPAPMIELWQR